MTTLTVDNLNKLRDGHPHAISVYLSIHVPTVLYEGLITGTPARGAREITVMAEAGYSLNAVTAGQTILVGTSAVGYDVSRRRYRSFTGTHDGAATIKLDENGVLWETGQNITIVENWELWPIFPFIEVTEPYTFYKDRDIAYTDENLEPPPVAIVEAAKRADFIIAGSAVFNISGALSYPIADGATIVSHAWTCSDGVIASAGSATTTITFTNPHPQGIWLNLTVTDSNGKSQTTRRLLFVYDEEYLPVKDFSIEQPVSISWKESGARVGLRMYGDVSLDVLPDRAHIVVWSKQRYNGTEEYIGDFYNTLFVGYVRGETIQRNLETDGGVSFEATTIADMLRRHSQFSVSLTDSTSPDSWHTMYRLTLSRAIHHVYKWHSTLLEIADLFLPDPTLYRMLAVDDFVNGDLFSIVESFASEHGVFAHICSNRMSQVHLAIDLNMLSDEERDALPVVMEILDVDRLNDAGDVIIQRRHEKTVGYVFMSGIYYSGSGDATPLISKAPGEVPETEGASFIDFENLVLLGQTDSNAKAGRVLAIANSLVVDVPITFVGNYSFFDVVPQEFYKITIFDSETPRDMNFIDMKLIPRRVTLSVDFVNGSINVDVLFDTEAIGPIGITGHFPTGSFEPEPEPTPEDTIANLITFNTSQGCYFHGSWVARNGGLTGSELQHYHASLDPYWYVKNESSNPADTILIAVTPGSVQRSVNAGVDWTAVSLSTPPNDAGDDPAPSAGDLVFMYIDSNFFVMGEHLVLATWSPTADDRRSWLLYTDDDFSTHSWVSIGVSVGGGGMLDERVFWAVDGLTTSVPFEKTICRMTDTTFAMVTRGSGIPRVSYGCVDPDDNLIYVTDGGGIVAVGVAAIAICRLTDERLIQAIAFTGSDCEANPNIKHVRVQVSNVVDGCPTPDLDTQVNDCVPGFGDFTGGLPSTIAIDSLGDGERFIVAVNRQPDGTAGGSCVVGEYVEGSGYDYGSTCIFASVACTNVSVVARADGAEVYYLETSSGDVKVAYIAISGLTAVLQATHDVEDGVDLVSAVMADAAHSAVSFKRTSDGYGYVKVVAVTSGSISMSSAQLMKTADIESCMVSSVGGTVYVAYNVAGVLTVKPCYVSGITISSVGLEISLPSDGGFLGVAALSSASFAASYYDSDNSDWSTVTVFMGDEIYAQGLGVAIGRGGGALAYVTYHNGSQLVLAVYELPSMALFAEYSLGAASANQVINLQRVAWPVTKTGYTDMVCYLHGLMESGEGLVQLIKTPNAGVSYQTIEGGWGGNYCSAMSVDRTGKLVATRNVGSGSKVYSGTDAGLSYNSDIPIRLYPGGLFVTVDGYAVVGSRVSGSAQRVMYAPRPYNSWTDITEDYPSSGGITKITGV